MEEAPRVEFGGRGEQKPRASNVNKKYYQACQTARLRMARRVAAEDSQGGTAFRTPQPKFHHSRDTGSGLAGGDKVPPGLREATR